MEGDFRGHVQEEGNIKIALPHTNGQEKGPISRCRHWLTGSFFSNQPCTIYTYYGRVGFPLRLIVQIFFFSFCIIPYQHRCTQRCSNRNAYLPFPTFARSSIGQFIDSAFSAGTVLGIDGKTYISIRTNNSNTVDFDLHIENYILSQTQSKRRKEADGKEALYTFKSSGMGSQGSDPHVCIGDYGCRTVQGSFHKNGKEKQEGPRG